MFENNANGMTYDKLKKRYLEIVNEKELYPNDYDMNCSNCFFKYHMHVGCLSRIEHKPKIYFSIDYRNRLWNIILPLSTIQVISDYLIDIKITHYCAYIDLWYDLKTNINKRKNSNSLHFEVYKDLSVKYLSNDTIESQLETEAVYKNTKSIHDICNEYKNLNMKGDRIYIDEKKNSIDFKRKINKVQTEPKKIKLRGKQNDKNNK